MLNGFFVVVVLLSVLVAAFSGQMEAITQASVDSAKKAVELALGLVGMMAFFLGLMRVAQDGGLLRTVSRAVAPLMRRLFPEVPPEHPAMSAMILNIACNMLGLGNAATPFGIRAMTELDRLNGLKGTATNAMILFLAINTSGLALLPTGVIAMRATAGSKDPAGIFLTTWFASGCATITAVTAALLLSRLRRYRATSPVRAEEQLSRLQAGGVEGEVSLENAPAEAPTPLRWGALAATVYGLALLVALVLHVGRSLGTQPAGVLVRGVLSYWVLPAVIVALVLFGWVRGVKVYTSLVEGAKEGFQVAVRIIPYLVAILVAVGMFRASGALELLVTLLDPIAGPLGMPVEAIPMAILRPLSGSGAYAVMAEVMSAHGPDSLVGYMVSTIQGSTETTFYVLAVYFGAVGVRETRHALPACLLADLAGIGASVLIVNLLFG